VKAKLLLIEDDPIARRLVELQLSTEGYELVTAPDGLQGLKIISENPPDLVLLDLMLPGLDGFEVLSRIRSDPKTAQLPVIVLSAKSRPTDTETANKMGASGYITKPYTKDELIGLVASSLSEAPAGAAPQGKCTITVGPQRAECVRTTVETGLALAKKAEPAIIADLHPFSIEYSILLDLEPREAPISIAEGPDFLTAAASHSSGLRLLDNMEGRGDSGQITPEDVSVVLDALVSAGMFAILDLPLAPSELVLAAAPRCARTLLVSPGDASSLRSCQAALTLLGRGGLAEEEIELVVVGKPAAEGPADLLARASLIIPDKGKSADQAFDGLAEKLRGAE
jgi:CheY-like chemotaxis protein